MAIDSDRRRMIFDQVRAKAMSRGMPIDNNPKFLAWVDLWISGEYEMSDLRSRYNDLVTCRTRRSKSVNGVDDELPQDTDPDAD
ncbi:hypothetical protein HNQ72_004353 [Rhizobium wenxiniae]|uniref:Antitoxin VbhA domain-containing protein n=1 Tax=Rhizobium wenxiniae TaxID=1737357 RepID=A0A7W9YB36_9HYPH|nr:hypothetical protein [Rhizobium wenxiniae]MBB6164508.1 hypothetical protein [Rhizobium wenxiniae]